MTREHDPHTGNRGEEMAESERKHGPVFPGFKEMAQRRHRLVSELESRRLELGLTQTEVAALMGTSQSAVARLESGGADIRLSTLERYAAALSQEIDFSLRPRNEEEHQ
jgi:DNA-binding XRE family transcriptional regulator